MDLWTKRSIKSQQKHLKTFIRPGKIKSSEKKRYHPAAQAALHDEWRETTGFFKSDQAQI